ncbi:MAG: ABC transporter permease [Alphaproteobacteria bacterium]
MNGQAKILAPRGSVDGRSLEIKLRAADRRRKLHAFLLVAPLFIFILVIFVLPILSLLYFSVDDPKLPRILPRTAVAVADWDGSQLPDENAYEALVTDIRVAYKAKTAAAIAMRLNYEISGFRSMVMRTGRKVNRIEGPPFKDALIALEKRWGDVTYWRAIKAAGGPFTTRYLLAAIDLQRRWDGSVGLAPPERTIYIDYLKRTFWISFWVLFYCIAIGYPMAYLIASVSKRLSRILLVLVLLPFWTSLLVRTAAWVVLLQNKGIVNDILLSLGLISEPLTLIFNRIGVYIAMVHILLPFLILPLYAVMKNIPGSHMRAAASLGARPLAVFLSVYLPQTLPGLGAGCLLVFILSLGFYITPALIGGASDQMLSYLIAEFATRTGNWGMASAIAILLLLSVAVLYPVYRGLIGSNGVRFR